MCTTAGAIFSTTSAMKLNLYLGLVSWWRPALAERTGPISDPASGPRAQPQGREEEAPPGGPGLRAPQGRPTLSSTVTPRCLGRGVPSPQEWLALSFPTLPLGTARRLEAQRD